MDYIKEMLYLIWKLDLFGEVYWDIKEKEESITFFMICNDVFYWGTADLVPIEKEDIPEVERAIKDAGNVDGVALYCARKRKMRPQGALYKHIPTRLWPLFDACGPERELDSGNPLKPGE